MGARPSSPASPREAEILTLLGAHLSNAEIAGQLHISVRTVENHVSSLLRKYGVAGRRALATLAADTKPEPRPEPRPEPQQEPEQKPGPPPSTGSPAWHTSFVGRSHERDNVLALLDAARLITLTGPGGVGKTRLASVVAAAGAPWFAGGAAFADLVPARPELVIQAIATALAVTEQPGESLDSAVLTRLGGGRTLLILDSCEHVLDAVAGFVDRVLTACPGTTILTTSRERLGVPGERVVPVAPLPLASDAEELFADRALAADPAFAADPAIIAEICARLDGMPLAIELAAARCASLGPAGLLTALDDAQRLLAGGRSRDERHRSLRAVIGWSHDLLDDDERALFRRLAVFASGFDIAAATAITPGSRPGPTADLIGRLADKSLVTRQEAEGSWRLMDTVRAYAADRLAASGELDAIRDRHLSWAAATASALRQRLDDQLDTRWRHDFDAVATELRDALEHCPPGPARTPHQLARAMGYLTFARRFLTEAPGHFQDAARRAPAPRDAAADLRAAARAVFATGLASRAFDLLLESAEQAGAAGDRDGRAAAIADAIVTAVRFPSGFPVQVPVERLRVLLAEALSAAGADTPAAGATTPPAVPGTPAVQARLAAARAAITAAGEDQPAIAEEAVTAARASGDPVLLSGSLDTLSAVHTRAGRLRAARRVTGERLALLDLMDRNHPYPAAEILSALHDAWLGALAVGDLPGALAIARAYGADDLLGAHPYRPASKLIPPLVLMGRFDEALGHAEALWDAFQRSGASIAVWVAPAAATAALALGLRGDDTGFRRWLARARRAAGPAAGPTAGPTVSDPPFAAFASIRLAVHTGAGDPAALVADAFALRARTWHQGYDQAAAAELAVTAGLPDAASRLGEVAAPAAESDWAAACVMRASGRLHRDLGALTEAAERWRRIAARFEQACTLRLLD